MATVYANLVRKGLWELEQVPARWREDVRRILIKDGTLAE